MSAIVEIMTENSLRYILFIFSERINLPQVHIKDIFVKITLLKKVKKNGVVFYFGTSLLIAVFPGCLGSSAVECLPLVQGVIPGS